jgi:hypothetical protein
MHPALRFSARSLMALSVAAGAAAAQSDMGREMNKSDKMAMGDGADYTIVVKSLWTPARQPLDYPAGSAHFSGIIGASHGASFTLFREGNKPTPGLERLSEMGAHSPLDAELRAVVTAGKAGSIVESGPLKNFASDSIVATVHVDAKNPMLSFVAMIAPSPDWFTGLANLNLMENGTWVTARTIELHAYDSGGDDGTTYKAADVDNNPKKPVSRASAKHFAPNGAPLAVAVVTITKK